MTDPHCVTVLGIDPALSNMGLVEAQVSLETGAIVSISMMTLVQTQKTKNKQTKIRSDDMMRARILVNALGQAASRCLLGMVEVPGGAKSARAAWALGLATGVIAGCSIPLIEVAPLEVKKAITGRNSASKQEIIEWAVSKFPAADWLRQKGRLVDKNEHLADALAIIHAGTLTEEFASWRAIARLTSR